MARNGSSFFMACTTALSMLESGKTQERESKGQTTVFHAASLTHSLQCGSFQSCTCADGQWLVGENSGCLFLKIEKKKTPSEWVVIYVYRYGDYTTQVVPGPGTRSSLAPEPPSRPSPPPGPVSSLHRLAVSYCQAHFWKPHQWSAFLLPCGTSSIQVVDAFSAVSVYLSQISSFSLLLTSPLYSWGQWTPTPLTLM